MDSPPYPGKGLSLSQLVFALNEELKYAKSTLTTFDEVSQLEQGISTALVATRELRNSFIYINRIPFDVFSLIPTYLPCQKDRFRVASVCRHWRRMLLQHSSLWSELFLLKGEIYVKTLLERAKGSALDIIVNRNPPFGAVAPLSPYIQQIRSLEFTGTDWAVILTFSEFTSEPLPLLRTLRIVLDSYALEPDAATASQLLFRNAINLENFVLHLRRFQPLNNFVFPNLTTLELSIFPGRAGFSASELLNFLGTSPMLRTIWIKIITDIMQEGVPRRTVDLRNVETLNLLTKDPAHLYEIASHISCPRARHTSFTCRARDVDVFPERQTFFTSSSWRTIAQQYTRRPVEKVTLQITYLMDPPVVCSLTFHSSDTSIITLGYEVTATGTLAHELQMSPDEMCCEMFCNALRVIRDHPFLASIKRLEINYHGFNSGGDFPGRFTGEFGRLFKSVGPLDLLSICGCDPHSYLAPFFDLPGSNDLVQLFVYPPIKELQILRPSLEEGFSDAIVNFAKSQHLRGIPFERVAVRLLKVPPAMEEGLKQWVGAVDSHEDTRLFGSAPRGAWPGGFL